MSEPKMITARQLNVLMSIHERRVIDPLFFGRNGDDPKVVKAEIDEADTEFIRLISDQFVLSNDLELPIN